MSDELNVPGAVPEPKGLDRALNYVPAALSSKPHIFFLMALGVYLVILPLLGLFHPSGASELIGGNYTNVASAVGGSIAAGGTVHLLRQDRHRRKASEKTHRIMADLYHHVTGQHHSDAPGKDAA